MVNNATILFIREHATDNVRMLALHKNRYPDVDIDFALQQIEGKQRTREKLPEIYQIEDWHYPVRLSLEQCSSETTAKYKAQIINSEIQKQKDSAIPQELTFTDLTGGFGIDTFYLSQHFKTTHYVERNADLCKIAEHNFARTRSHILVHHAQAEEYLQTMKPVDVIYLDPARRNTAGGKVFRLQDCEPDLTTLYTTLMTKCKVLMVKLSPMIDITEALRHLPNAQEIHIVAVKNEVKEVLILITPNTSKDHLHSTIKRVAINLDTNDTPFIFTLTEEENNRNAITPPYEKWLTGAQKFLYEPNAAILKAGAFRTVANRYQLQKLATNTHLYTSDNLIENFPGRIFNILGTPDKTQLKALQKTGAHTICRNYPLSAEQLAAKHKIKEGGTHYLIGTHINKKNTLLLAERIR